MLVIIDEESLEIEIDDFEDILVTFFNNSRWCRICLFILAKDSFMFFPPVVQFRWDAADYEHLDWVQLW